MVIFFCKKKVTFFQKKIYGSDVFSPKEDSLLLRRQTFFIFKRRFLDFSLQKEIPTYIQLAENDLTLRKMTTKPSIIIWSILPKDVPVTCKSGFFTSCKIIKMVHYLLLLNTPVKALSRWSFFFQSPCSYKIDAIC